MYSKIISSLVFLALISNAALAQITPDSSLGGERSVVDSDGNRDTINGGAVRNANLFHSFQEFNVGIGRETYFNNPNGIANIFSRVTGNNISDIQGVLGILGNANLYLINPNGILFGENARLDVNGSFFATTADSVLFGNGFEFSAANPNQPPLLTINIPIGLRFRDNPGDITVEGKGNGTRLPDSEVIDTQEALRVDSESTIGLVGGNLFFEDATIKTAGGRIEIGSVAEGEVNLVEVANGFTVDYSGVETFRDISLSGTSTIDASGLGGGDIQVAGKNISIAGNSDFSSGTLGAKPGGDINILATESLEISGVENENNFLSGIANQVFPSGTADGGDINIETGSLRLGDRAGIATIIFGQGNAGNIKITARESISLESQGNNSVIGSYVIDQGVGNAGNIELNTGSLTLINGAGIDSIISSSGDGDNILTDILESAIFSVVEEEAVGNAGEIRINTKNLFLTNGAFVASDTLGQGDAGLIEINATENIFLNGESRDGDSSGIGSSVAEEAVGNAGEIRINTKNLSLTNGAQVLSSTFSKGNAGLVKINATENIFLDGEGTDGISSLIASSVETGAVGDGGTVQIDAKNFFLTNGARISAATSGKGNAGNIIINTKNLSLTKGSQIGSATFDRGNAGNVIINATESISLDGKGKDVGISEIDSSVLLGAVGNGGEIRLNTKNLSLTNGARIRSSTMGKGNAGNVTINADESIFLDGANSNGLNSAIDNPVQEKAVGNGGEIRLNTFLG